MMLALALALPRTQHLHLAEEGTPKRFRGLSLYRNVRNSALFYQKKVSDETEYPENSAET